MVQCSAVLTSLSFQTFSHLSLVKLIGRHDFQFQTSMVNIFCWHSSLDVPCGLQVLLNTTDCHFSFINKVGTKYSFLSWLNLVEQGAASMYTTLQTVPSLDFLSSCCCMKTQPMANSCPSCLDVPLRRLLAYLPIFGSLAQFGYLFAGDRLNYGSNESQGKHAIVPRSEQQTMILD
jgi:hypothetical protein